VAPDLPVEMLQHLIELVAAIAADMDLQPHIPDRVGVRPVKEMLDGALADAQLRLLAAALQIQQRRQAASQGEAAGQSAAGPSGALPGVIDVFPEVMGDADADVAFVATIRRNLRRVRTTAWP